MDPFVGIGVEGERDAVMPPNQCEIVRNYDKVGRSKR